MVYIDTHCHLDFYSDEQIEGIVERAREVGVGTMVCNGVKPESNSRVLEIAAKYLEVKAALGLYPTDALKMSDEKVDDALGFIRENAGKIVAIGEVGIDFKETEDRERQKAIFDKVIALAVELDKPLIVHSRKAEAEAIEMLERAGAKKVVMHCFSGKFKLVQKIVDLGWKMTIPTNVKRSEHFQKVIREVPIENLLCETDSPYLHPDKEMNNEPKNVLVSYEKIAEIKGLIIKEVEMQIEKNFRELVNGVSSNIK